MNPVSHKPLALLEVILIQANRNETDIILEVYQGLGEGQSNKIYPLLRLGKNKNYDKRLGLTADPGVMPFVPGDIFELVPYEEMQKLRQELAEVYQQTNQPAPPVLDTALDYLNQLVESALVGGYMEGPVLVATACLEDGSELEIKVNKRKSEPGNQVAEELTTAEARATDNARVEANIRPTLRRRESVEELTSEEKQLAAEAWAEIEAMARGEPTAEDKAWAESHAQISLSKRIPAEDLTPENKQAATDAWAWQNDAQVMTRIEEERAKVEERQLDDSWTEHRAKIQANRQDPQGGN